MRIACAILTVLLFPFAAYTPQLGYWLSLVGAALILGLVWVAWPADWVERSGLRISLRAAAGALLLFAATAVSAYGLLIVAAGATDVQFIPAHEHSRFLRNVLFSAGQTLNEEIVLGALLLFGLARWLGRRRSLAISVGVALVFTMLHYAFYAFRAPEDANAGRLSILALTALFAVGVLRNNLILGCRHIAFAWAIHLGWNVYFFGSEFRFGPDCQPLSEPERFNRLLANPLVLGVLGFSAWASIYFFRRTLCGRRGRPS